MKVYNYHLLSLVFISSLQSITGKLWKYYLLSTLGLYSCIDIQQQNIILLTWELFADIFFFTLFLMHLFCKALWDHDEMIIARLALECMCCGSYIPVSIFSRKTPFCKLGNCLPDTVSSHFSRAIKYLKPSQKHDVNTI